MLKVRGTAVWLVGATLIAFAQHFAVGQITYISSLAQPVAADALVEQTDWFACSFTTGPDALGYDLNSVQVGLDGRNVDASGFSVSVFSDDGGKPGSDLGTLSGNSDPISSGDYTYTSSGIGLSPSTSYWIVLATASTEPTGYYWNITTSASYTSSDDWTIDTTSTYVSGNQGTSWRAANTGEGQFSVTATSVPEPASLSVGALTMAILLIRRRR